VIQEILPFSYLNVCFSICRYPAARILAPSDAHICPWSVNQPVNISRRALKFLADPADLYERMIISKGRREEQAIIPFILSRHARLPWRGPARETFQKPQVKPEKI
jgi:hypothetical protein